MHMIQCCGQVAVYLRSSTMTMLKKRRRGSRPESVGGAGKLHAHIEQEARLRERTGIRICSVLGGADKLCQRRLMA